MIHFSLNFKKLKEHLRIHFIFSRIYLAALSSHTRYNSCSWHVSKKSYKIFSRCIKKNQKMKWTWHETQLPFHIILIWKYNSYLQTIEYIYNEKDVKYKKNHQDRIPWAICEFAYGFCCMGLIGTADETWLFREG